MANGFDLIAAEEVLNAKKVFPYIQLKAVIPFKGQADRYTQADKQRYNAILAQADEVIILQDEYSSVVSCIVIITYWITPPISWYFTTVPRRAELPTRCAMQWNGK